MKITIQVTSGEPNIEGADKDFIAGLRRMMSLGVEVEILRRGFQGDNYTLHGVIVAVDDLGSVKIRRTRSHHGEVHTMDSRYMFRASAPGTLTIGNRTALAREISYQQRRQGRDLALQRAAREPAFIPDAPDNATRIASCTPNSVGGVTCLIHSSRDVRAYVSASNRGAAEKTLRCLDLFMPLEDLTPIALRAAFLWPRTWNRDWGLGPAESGAADWRDWASLRALMQWANSVPASAFRAVLQCARGKSVDDIVKLLSEPEQDALKNCGLLSELPPPSPEAALNMLHLQDLRHLMKVLGTGRKSVSSEPLRQHILEHMNPEVGREIMRLSRHAKFEFKDPADISISAIGHYEDQYRFMLHALRKWLHFEEDIGSPSNQSNGL